MDQQILLKYYSSHNQLDSKDIEEKQSIRFSNVNKISYKIIIFSVTTLILMTITNIVQARKLKNFFKIKKLI